MYHYGTGLTCWSCRCTIRKISMCNQNAVGGRDDKCVRAAKEIVKFGFVHALTFIKPPFRDGKNSSILLMQVNLGELCCELNDVENRILTITQNKHTHTFAAA